MKCKRSIISEDTECALSSKLGRPLQYHLQLILEILLPFLLCSLRYPIIIIIMDKSRHHDRHLEWSSASRLGALPITAVFVIIGESFQVRSVGWFLQLWDFRRICIRGRVLTEVCLVYGNSSIHDLKCINSVNDTDYVKLSSAKLMETTEQNSMVAQKQLKYPMPRQCYWCNTTVTCQWRRGPIKGVYLCNKCTYWIQEVVFILTRLKFLTI